MSGSGADGGFDYQADAFAAIAAYGLAEQPLDWFDDACDYPVAISSETSGPGDDLRIETSNGAILEIQVKSRLRKDRRFWDSIERLLSGLHDHPTLRGVLFIDSTSSQVIRRDFRQDVDRIGGGRTDSLRRIDTLMAKNV